MMKSFLAAFSLLWLAATLFGAENNLAQKFSQPPADARLWVYWFWLDGNITKQTITDDLEAMARVGVGGVLIMDVNQGTPTGPIPFNSPQWREMFAFAVTEAKRLGLEINMNNDAGWTGSGGPWIKPEEAMQQLTVSETPAAGGQHFEAILPQPTTIMEYYRDSAVIAYPTPDEDDNYGQGAKITTSTPNPGNPEAFLQSQWPNFVLKGQARLLKPAFEMPVPTPDKPQWIQAEFEKPFTARSISFGYRSRDVRHGPIGQIQVSDDGVNFRTIREFRGQPPEVTVNIPETTARFFRLYLSDVLEARAVSVTHFFVLPAYRIENLAGKAVMTPSQFHIGHRGAPPVPSEYPTIPAALTIPHSRVIDLTAKMDASGKLTWDVPQGKWTILRVGHTLTGMMTDHPPVGGKGLESDKLSKAATKASYDGFIGQLVAENRKLTGIGQAFVSTHVDSWEVLSQNWTPLMRQEFKRLRGYDMLPYLPVLTGRIVDSPEVSERFLWDFRLTVADLVVENYSAEMRRLAAKDNIRFSFEAYDGPPADEVRLGGEASEPMGEVWYSGKFNTSWSVEEMASAAHIYNRPVVGVEAFTANWFEAYKAHPATIKELGDWAFAQGVNRLVVHRYSMQPWGNQRFPGMSMGPWGVHYERTQTWWEYTHLWHDYVARCQFLLRQGLPVNDLLVVNPENATRYRVPQSVNPDYYSLEALRTGYNYDVCPPEALISLVQGKDGRATLANGTSYRAVALPDVPAMTPALLRKIKELADAGVVLFGSPAPTKSPSLAGFPQCDAEVKKLAGEIWSRVITDQTPAQYFAARHVPPDFDSRTQSEKKLRFIHRAIGATDIYFVASAQQKPESALLYFRSTGRRPELWWPDTGRFEQPAVYNEVNGQIVLPIQFEPSGSVFVVFRDGNPIEPDRVTDVTRAGNTVLTTESLATVENSSLTASISLRRETKGAVELEALDPGTYQLRLANDQRKDIEITAAKPLSIVGPWQVAFDPKWGGPEDPVTFSTLTDWAKSDIPGIRYYSGAATYRTTFGVDAALLKDKDVFLDLGNVAILAEVKLNGRLLGTLWKPPFRVNAAGVLKVGDNTLEIKVVNTWVNRMIGDEALPEDSERDYGGFTGAFLKSYPQWLLEGKPSPAGRYTFTTWRLFKKDDPLTESGLLGPVVLQPMQKVVAKLAAGGD